MNEKDLKYLPVMKEVLQEFGFSIKTGVYSLVGYYSTYGKGLFESKKTIAEYLKCGKSAVCAALSELIASKYITAEYRYNKDTKEHDTTLYRLNPDNPLSKIWTYPESRQPLVQILDNPSPENGQPLVQILDNPSPKSGHNKIKDKRNSYKIIDEVEKTTAAQPQKLTAEQENEIRHGYDLTNCNHHNPEYYLAKQSKYSFDAIINFILDDGGRKRTEDGTAYSSNSSSIDKSELDALMQSLM